MNEVDNTPGIVDKEPSKVAIIAHHTGGLVGMIMSLIWIVFLVLITYFEPLQQEFFLSSWYNLGFFLAILPSITDLIQHTWKFVLGKVQLIFAIQASNEAITGLCLLLLAILYPFDFANLNELVPYILYGLAALSFLSSISTLYKFINWDDIDKRSLL